LGPLPPEVRPEMNIENMEYGGRFCCFLGGVDFSLMALRTWSKMPVLMENHLGYYRITAIGGDVSIPFGDFVFRGEMADYIDDHGDHQGNALAGLDWYPGGDWNVSVQFNQTFGDDESSLATLRLSKDLFNNSLTLSTFAYADLVDMGIFNRFSADWSATDQIHVILGYDYFNADEGIFTAYAHNSEIWLKIKYCY